MDYGRMMIYRRDMGSWDYGVMALRCQGVKVSGRGRSYLASETFQQIRMQHNENNTLALLNHPEPLVFLLFPT